MQEGRFTNTNTDLQILHRVHTNTVSTTLSFRLHRHRHHTTTLITRRRFIAAAQSSTPLEKAATCVT